MCNPPYEYYLYHIWANLQVLNRHLPVITVMHIARIHALLMDIARRTADG